MDVTEFATTVVSEVCIIGPCVLGREPVVGGSVRIGLDRDVVRERRIASWGRQDDGRFHVSGWLCLKLCSGYSDT